MYYRIVKLVEPIVAIGLIIFLFLGIIAMIIAMCNFIRYLYLLH